MPRDLPQPSEAAAVLADSILNTRKTLTTKSGQVDRRKLGLMIDKAVVDGGVSVAGLIGTADDILAMRETIGTKAGRKNRQTMAEYIWHGMRDAQTPQEASQPQDPPDVPPEPPEAPEAIQTPAEATRDPARKEAVRNLTSDNTWEIEGLVRKAGGLVQEASLIQNQALLVRYLAQEEKGVGSVLKEIVSRCRRLRAAAGDLMDSLINEANGG